MVEATTKLDIDLKPNIRDLQANIIIPFFKQKSKKNFEIKY